MTLEPTDDEEIKPPEPAFPIEPNEPGAPSLSENADAGVTRLLSGILRLRIFLTLHESAANPEMHKLRAAICFAADFLVRFIAVALIFGVAAVVIWKTFGPLPPFYNDQQ